MTVILFASKTKLSPCHNRVFAWADDVEHEVLFVRAELDKSGDPPERVLERAKARRGETFLNIIEL